MWIDTHNPLVLALALKGCQVVTRLPSDFSGPISGEKVETTKWSGNLRPPIIL